MVENRKVLSKGMYYFLSWTWGFLMSFIGLIVIGSIKLWCFLTKKDCPLKTWGYSKYLNVGRSWGGLEFGMWFLTDSSDGRYVKNHELGHGVQNCFWGPLTLFVIFLPSAIRYWIFNFKTIKSKYTFAGVLTLIAWMLATSFLIVGLTYNSIFCYILSTILFVYFAIISLWLNYIEIPKHKNNKTVNYYSIWFEGDASRTGAKYINYLEENQKNV